MRTIHHPIHYQNRITGYWFIFIHTPHESANGTLKCHSEGFFLHTFVLFWFTINFLNCFFHSDACEPDLWFRFRSRFRFHFFLAPNHCTNRFLLFISLFDCYRFLPAVTIFRLKLNSYRPHFAGMIIMQIEQIPKKKVVASTVFCQFFLLSLLLLYTIFWLSTNQFSIYANSRLDYVCWTTKKSETKLMCRKKADAADH